MGSQGLPGGDRTSNAVVKQQPRWTALIIQLKHRTLHTSRALLAARFRRLSQQVVVELREKVESIGRLDNLPGLPPNAQGAGGVGSGAPHEHEALCNALRVVAREAWRGGLRLITSSWTMHVWGDADIFVLDHRCGFIGMTPLVDVFADVLA